MWIHTFVFYLHSSEHYCQLGTTYYAYCRLALAYMDWPHALSMLAATLNKPCTALSVICVFCYFGRSVTNTNLMPEIVHISTGGVQPQHADQLCLCLFFVFPILAVLFDQHFLAFTASSTNVCRRRGRGPTARLHTIADRNLRSRNNGLQNRCKGVFVLWIICCSRMHFHCQVRASPLLPLPDFRPAHTVHDYHSSAPIMIAQVDFASPILAEGLLQSPSSFSLLANAVLAACCFLILLPYAGDLACSLIAATPPLLSPPPSLFSALGCLLSLVCSLLPATLLFRLVLVPELALLLASFLPAVLLPTWSIPFACTSFLPHCVFLHLAFSSFFPSVSLGLQSTWICLQNLIFPRRRACFHPLHTSSSFSVAWIGFHCNLLAFCFSPLQSVLLVGFAAPPLVVFGCLLPWLHFAAAAPVSSWVPLALSSSVPGRASFSLLLLFLSCGSLSLHCSRFLCKCDTRCAKRPPKLSKAARAVRLATPSGQLILLSLPDIAAFLRHFCPLPRSKWRHFLFVCSNRLGACVVARCSRTWGLFHLIALRFALFLVFLALLPCDRVLRLRLVCDQQSPRVVCLATAAAAENRSAGVEPVLQANLAGFLADTVARIGAYGRLIISLFTWARAGSVSHNTGKFGHLGSSPHFHIVLLAASAILLLPSLRPSAVQCCPNVPLCGAKSSSTPTRTTPSLRHRYRHMCAYACRFALEFDSTLGYPGEGPTSANEFITRETRTDNPYAAHLFPSPLTPPTSFAPSHPDLAASPTPSPIDSHAPLLPRTAPPSPLAPPASPPSASLPSFAPPSLLPPPGLSHPSQDQARRRPHKPLPLCPYDTAHALVKHTHQGSTTLVCTLCALKIKRSAPIFCCNICKPRFSACSSCAATLPASGTTATSPSQPMPLGSTGQRLARLTPKVVLPPVSALPTGPLPVLPGPFPPAPLLPGFSPPAIVPVAIVPPPPLLGLLRRIPDMPSVSSLLFPPQRLAHKFAEHYVTALWKFCNTAVSTDLTSDAQLEASLFAKWLPLLLLHISPDTDSQLATSKVRSDLKRRMQLADLGKWHDLINDLLEADASARTALDKRSGTSSAVQSRVNKYTAVCKKVQGNCIRSAAQILTGAGQPPANHDTFDAICKLFVCSEQPDAQAPLVQSCLDSMRVSSGWSPNLRQLTRRVANLRNGAQPGPSKCRNTHLKLCLRARWGPPTLLEWSRLWCTGQIPQHMARPFLDGWIAPLSKPGGKGIRPIALFECPLKLATGLLMEHCTPAVAATVAPYQFGIGMPAGAEVMLKTIQAVAAAHPDLAFGSSDVKNAFGTVFRSAALATASKLQPTITPALAQMWQPGPTCMHAQCSPTEWKSLFVSDGVFQGECLSTAIFCLVMHEAILDFYKRIGPVLAACVFVFAYVDDVVLVFPPSSAAVVWAAWREALLHRGLHLEQTKCRSWIPSATEVLPTLNSVVVQDLSGLPLLGSAAEGEFESCLGPFALHSAPVQKRLDNARLLTSALLDMCSVVLECPSRQCIWILLSRLLCHRLDFDARMLSHSTIESFTGMLDQLVDSVIHKLLPDVPLLQIRPQLSLPGHLGGAFLLPACDVALCAPLASHLQTYPIVCNTLRALRLPGVIPFVCTKAAAISIAQLQARGADPSTILQHHVDLSRPSPFSLTKAHGRLIGFCAERRLQSILGTLTSFETARVLSCGGPGNGEWLRTPSPTLQQGFTDSQFLTALRWRLGLRVIPAYLVSCRHQYVKTSARECGHPFDHTGHHSVMCNVGGGPTIFLHNPIAELAASFLTSAGFDARREVSIPEFTCQRVNPLNPNGVDFIDGIVDVLGWHVVLGEFLLDVTVRHPLAVQVAKRAATVAGTAALAGERDKHLRYPAKAGRCIVPLAIETFGRIGSEFDEWLMTLASAARARDRASGLSGSRHLTSWRAALNTALYKGIAKTIEDSCTLCRTIDGPPAYADTTFIR